MQNSSAHYLTVSFNLDIIVEYDPLAGDNPVQVASELQKNLDKQLLGVSSDFIKASGEVISIVPVNI